jgi:hypothetical protein
MSDAPSDPATIFSDNTATAAEYARSHDASATVFAEHSPEQRFILLMLAHSSMARSRISGASSSISIRGLTLLNSTAATSSSSDNDLLAAGIRIAGKRTLLASTASPGFLDSMVAPHFFWCSHMTDTLHAPLYRDRRAQIRVWEGDASMLFR